MCANPSTTYDTRLSTKYVAFLGGLLAESARVAGKNNRMGGRFDSWDGRSSMPTKGASPTIRLCGEWKNRLRSISGVLLFCRESFSA
jgi:hypothetical protein